MGRLSIRREGGAGEGNTLLDFNRKAEHAVRLLENEVSGDSHCPACAKIVKGPGEMGVVSLAG